MNLAPKLQLRPGQHVEMVMVPDSVAAALGEPELTAVGQPEAALLVFVANSAGLEASRAQIVGAALGDRLTWVAYPKSGQLATDLNRDSLAASLLKNGVQPVRQIAIDEVWSAVRFRPAG
ncbi:MAG: hypothetical protein ACRENX_10530 [Candidatus Dormibacteria bacterium]